MEIRKINDSTIRCIITQQDMEEHQIDLDDFLEHKPRAMQYLKSILEEAAQKEDFRADGPFTSMQVRVLQDSSICLTLTQGLMPDLLNILHGLAAKLSEMSSEEDKPEPDHDAVSPEDPHQETSEVAYAILFDRMNDVIQGCRHVPKLTEQDSSLYYLREERTYYLIIAPRGEEAGYERTLLSMNEFGEFMELDAAEVRYIREHGICILKEKAAQHLLSV